MSHAFVAGLAVTVVVIFVCRLVFTGLPIRRVAVRVSAVDATLVAIGTLGLVFHCGSMFFRIDVQRIPATHAAIAAINAMGTASRLWYSVPALLVVIGLRRQNPVALLVLAAAFISVGVTMYDHGALRTHLDAIFVAGTVLAAVVALLVLPPWRQPNISATSRPRALARRS